MVIFTRQFLKEILYELEYRDEIMAKKGLTPDMYYAYMVGRMEPVLRWIVKADKIENRRLNKWNLSKHFLQNLIRDQFTK